MKESGLESEGKGGGEKSILGLKVIAMDTGYFTAYIYTTGIETTKRQSLNLTRPQAWSFGSNLVSF